MLARVRSAAVLGIDAYLVDVETDIASGLPTFVTRREPSRSGVSPRRAKGVGSTFWARASTLLSGYSMPTFLMSALKRGSGRRGSKMGEGAMNGSHSARSS